MTSGRVKLNAEETSGLVYSRFNNPNLEVLEDRISVLEEADDACVFSSGMSAITTAAMAFLRPGMSMVMSKPIYGGTSSLFSTFFPEMGITVVPMTDGMTIEGITSAMNEAARHGQLGMVLIETPANPTNTLIDIGLVGGQCHAARHAVAGTSRFSSSTTPSSARSIRSRCCTAPIWWPIR